MTRGYNNTNSITATIFVYHQNHNTYHDQLFLSKKVIATGFARMFWIKVRDLFCFHLGTSESYISLSVIQGTPTNSKK